MPAALNCLTTWFIPAGAGNTCAAIWSNVYPAVYPRRGEHGTSPRRTDAMCGLSAGAGNTIAIPHITS
ncbi:hypothetical protein KCP71_11655 [Salmonella enterica subsp. enterica]|nr:hypothetical protein KCP71_11655 [Salmonella enterica subsp. enterica]